jgi:hypothetical protein
VLLTYTTFNLRCLDLLFTTSEDSTISHTTILPLGNHGSIDTLLAALSKSRHLKLKVVYVSNTSGVL